MKLGFIILLFASTLVAHAHVGSPNVFLDGQVGDYLVHVIVRPPNVVPGLAEIAIRVEGQGVRRVTALPVFWDAGRKGAPPPEEARLVRGETNVFAATLWLMKSGGYSVDVNVEGTHGGGTVNVPVDAVATNTRGMSVPYSLMLLTLAVLLFSGAVRIAGAIFGESLLVPGENADAANIRWGRFAMVITSVAISLLLWGGKKWWDSAEKEYRQKVLYRPAGLSTSIVENDKQNILVVNIDDADGAAQSRRLMTDHGKLMHMFLIREPDLKVFAHLHPVKRTWQNFEVALPPLPAGNYQVYADITHETGFAETLTTHVGLPASSQKIMQYWAAGSTDQICGTGVGRTAPPEGFPLQPDPDDAWHVDQRKQENQTKTVAQVSGGYSMVWRPARELIENRELSLRFELMATNGLPKNLEPYIGMFGHAVVRRNDGGVFAHLHPAGTFSMAAQEYFANSILANERHPRGSNTNFVDALPESRAIEGHQMTTNANPIRAVSFPYAFPTAGAYHIWVQLKSEGKVYTGVFEAEVKSAGTDKALARLGR